MSGDSGMQDALNGFNVDNDGLTNMQNYMQTQSRNQLNKEMVRSAAYFGFGERPEPKDMAPPPKASNPFSPSSIAHNVFGFKVKEENSPTDLGNN